MRWICQTFINTIQNFVSIKSIHIDKMMHPQCKRVAHFLSFPPIPKLTNNPPDVSKCFWRKTMSSLVGKIPQSWRHSSSYEQSIVPDLSLSRFLNSRSKSLKKGKYNGYLYSSFESVDFENTEELAKSQST